MSNVSQTKISSHIRIRNSVILKYVTIPYIMIIPLTLIILNMKSHTFLQTLIVNPGKSLNLKSYSYNIIINSGIKVRRKCNQSNSKYK